MRGSNKIPPLAMAEYIVTICSGVTAASLNGLAGRRHESQQRPVGDQNADRPQDLPADVRKHHDYTRGQTGDADAPENTREPDVGNIERDGSVLDEGVRETQAATPG